jgi:pimeloyl-ACP methyl ester carboxylesterase
VIKILPLLTNASSEGGPTFHVVAPSLPNFGFSQAASKKGFSLPQYAEVCHKLMQRLGYERYVSQGGDWGFIITRLMASKYPDHCLATHINFMTPFPPSPFRHPLLFLQLLFMPWTSWERAGVARSKWYATEGSGYFVTQSTRPSTLGFALADSPVALLAWIYEKLHDWTDDYPWTDDEVLTWISLYQFSTSGPAASVRIYYELVHSQWKDTTKGLGYNAVAKLGISNFPKDLMLLPKTFAKTLGPLSFEASHDHGGHFAAYETPEVLVGDLRKMFGEAGGAYSVTRKFAPLT